MNPKRARVAPADLAAFYDSLQELLRIYQFRNRDQACYGTITPNECYALEAIERAGTLCVTELATCLGLHKSNASRLAAGLAARKLLRRSKNVDNARRLSLELTPRGQALHAAIRARVEQAHREILETFSPANGRLFIRLLDALAAEARDRVGSGCGSATADDDAKGETAC